MDWFYKDYLNREYDESVVNEIIEGYKANRVSSFRVNTLKANIDEIEDILSSNKIIYHKVNFYDAAFYIDNSDIDKVRNLDIYIDGKIYLQSLSSMLPPLFMDVKEGESILDMTAAPGGKTSLIAALSKNKVLITAIEKNKIRCDRLKYNLDKLGVKKVTTLNVDASNLDPYFRFDKILLDAPCSGSGTILLNESKNFNKELIDKCIKIQKILLTKAIEVLKIGGTLIYSTCSILKEENEDIVNEVLKRGNVKIVPISLNELPKLPTNIDGVICVRPTDLYEGFFLAKLEKIK